MAFRFIHTADWQIGKPFRQFPEEAAIELKLHRLSTVARIAEEARARQVDAVLVAGDAFDSNAVSDRTLVQTMEALRGFSGTWVFLPGNHDAALQHSVWTRLRALGLPPNVVIADEPMPVDRWQSRAAVLPAPLRRRREAADLTDWFATAPSPDGAIRIGLAHGSVAGRLPGASEAANEIAGDRAQTANLAYLALGDWHGALEIAPRTFYSGTPEPDRHKDNAPGAVYLVTLEGPDAPPDVERVAVGRFRWTQLDVALLYGTAGRLVEALDALEGAPVDTVLALRVSGSLALTERLRLEAVLEGWRHRLHHLDLDDAALRDEPTDDDLDGIDTAGFVRVAVERLRLKAADPLDPQREAARMALRMVFLDHAAGGGR